MKMKVPRLPAIVPALIAAGTFLYGMYKATIGQKVIQVGDLVVWRLSARMLSTFNQLYADHGDGPFKVTRVRYSDSVGANMLTFETTGEEEFNEDMFRIKRKGNTDVDLGSNSSGDQASQS